MERLTQTVSRLIGEEIIAADQLTGGSISQAARVQIADGCTLVAKISPVAAQEARMLLAMKDLGAPVPDVVAQQNDVLVLEDLGPGTALGDNHWQAMPLVLAPLRQTGEPRFGWHEDYRLASVDVPNSRSTSWIEFWRDHRLLCHAEHLPADLARRAEALATDLPNRIPGQPPAALVHGDLWGGNIVAGANGRIWLIDPCAYYGDREVDVATLTVFDRPPQAMFDALELDPDWQERLPVYRLWMWLIHVRLFGESYRPAAESDFAKLGV